MTLFYQVCNIHLNEIKKHRERQVEPYILLSYYQIMSWIYLLIASLFEVGWPISLKMAELTSAKALWLIIAIISMALSGVFLYYAQKEISIGTAYAVWTGIGASCTFIIGILFFNDTANLMRFLGVMLIIFGVILLKAGH